jgi:hypothetical protein
MIYSDILFAEGQNNMGGFRTIGWYGFIEDVDTFPEIPATPADIASANVITGDIVMKAGKYMYKMYGTAETTGLNGESQGERDGRSTKRTATWFYPTTSEEALGITVAFQNRNMFFVFQEHDGKKRLQGSPAFPAECAINDTTGTAVTDRKGITITITDNGFGGCPIYKGVVPVAPET